jgi:hypothetical protein
VLHLFKIEPLRIRYDSDVLNVRAVRGVGYRFRCECGEQGKRCETWIGARLDGLAHRESVKSESHASDRS